MEELKESSNLKSEKLTGTLSISSVPGICTSLLPKTIVDYKNRFPGISIKIFENGTPQIIEDITTEKHHLGFVAFTDKGYFKEHTELFYKELADCKVMVCVGRKSPLSAKNSITLEEIIKEPIVPFKPGYQMYLGILELLRKYGQPNILYSSTNSIMGKQIMAEGIGVGFCSGLTIKNDPFFTSGKLIAIPISNADIKLSYGYIRLKKRHLSTAAKEFLRVVGDNLI